MRAPLQWSALRRTSRSCAIGALPLLAFLGLWQFLVPGGDPEEDVFATWALLLVSSLCVAFGIGYSGAASRAIWRRGCRARALLPLAVLPLSVVALSWLGANLGAFPLLVACSLAGFVLPAALAAYLIVSTPAAEPPAEPLAAPDVEPHAYARDVDPKRSAL